MKTLLEIRLAVAFLGEREQFRWWDTGFLNPLGLRYAGLTFPKTAASAAAGAASKAACRVHDERIGKGSVAHVFRFPEDTELRMRRQCLQLQASEVLEWCSQDAAFRILDTIAAGADAVGGTGPVQIASLQEATTPRSLAKAAATYAAAFRSRTVVFPYFA